MNLNLFGKEKELILKITNAILIIWIVAALCFMVSNLATIFIKDENIAYEYYEKLYCIDNQEKGECEELYLGYVDSQNDDIVYEKRSAIICFLNVIIVSGFIIGLNKNKKKKK